MAFGALSSLGAGSGVLTYDVIDKLKNADKATMITPFETRMKNVENQQKQLSALTTQINLFKSSIADFKDGEIFQKRLANVTGSSVSATVNHGVSVQKITMRKAFTKFVCMPTTRKSSYSSCFIGCK
jgi:flagellar hook-associated protein 2